MTVDEMMLNLFSHPYYDVLWNLAEMGSKKFIGNGGIWIWETYATSSILLMVRSPWGLLSISNLCGVLAPTGSLHKNYCLLVLWQDYTIPSRDAYVSPF